MTSEKHAVDAAPRSRLSVTARITMVCVGVALVAAALASLATARVLIAMEERDLANGTLRQVVQEFRVGETNPLRQARAVARRPIVLQSVLLSLGVGLAVGATAGGSMAAVLTRPLRRTADVARAMGSGRRDVRVPVEGPPEIADVAESLNELADALMAEVEKILKGEE